MNITEISTLLALHGEIDALLFRAYADECPHWKRKDFPGLSVTEQEGQVLYALTRLLRPDRVLEFGVCGGYSSTHILSALAQNGNGELVSFDIDELQPPGPPLELRDRWTFRQENGITAEIHGPFDIVFEDTSHTRGSTTSLLLKSMNYAPRCVIVHDIANRTSGVEVAQAMVDIFGAGKYAIVVPDDSNLGLAIWFRKTK